MTDIIQKIYKNEETQKTILVRIAGKGICAAYEIKEPQISVFDGSIRIENDEDVSIEFDLDNTKSIQYIEEDDMYIIDLNVCKIFLEL